MAEQCGYISPSPEAIRCLTPATHTLRQWHDAGPNYPQGRYAYFGGHMCEQHATQYAALLTAHGAEMINIERHGAWHGTPQYAPSICYKYPIEAALIGMP